MAKAKYGNSYEKYPIQEHEIWSLDDGEGFVAIHDIYNPLPSFVYEADMVITDLPYNLQMVNGYYTKADKQGEHDKSFKEFYLAVLNQIDLINPHTLFLEIGKQNVEKLKIELEQRFKFVEVFTVYYFKTNECYLIRASNNGYSDIEYTGLDEVNAIDLACYVEDYQCVADILMGQGAVAEASYKAEKKFVGTELNPRRLAVTIEKIAKLGGKWLKGDKA